MVNQVKQVVTMRDIDSELWKRVRVESLSAGITVPEYVQLAIRSLWGEGGKPKKGVMSIAGGATKDDSTTTVVVTGEHRAGTSAEVSEPKVGGRYEEWIAKKVPAADAPDPTLEVKEPEVELPVWVETPFKPGRPKGWMCRVHKTSNCGECEPMNEWLERVNRGN